MFLKIALNIKLFTGLHYKKSISGENAVQELCSVIAIKEVIKKPPVRTLTLLRLYSTKVQSFRKYSFKFMIIFDALRDLVPFVQFKKREKHPWRSVTFSKVVG